MLMTIKQECNTAVKSYTSVTISSSESSNSDTETENIKKTAKVAWEEEISDDQDKIKREKYIIIYGVEEPSEDTKRDKKWVNNLIKEFRVNMKRIARIGSSDGEKVIIVNLGSEDEKTKLFENLKLSKGLQE